MSEPAPPSASLVRILFVRLRFILVFVVVGLIVGNWSAITNLVDRMTRPENAADRVLGEYEWFCPMHPSVVRPDDTQNCPICGMPLSRRKRGEAAATPAGTLGRLQISPYRIRQAGVGTTAIGYRLLVREIRTVGFIDYDERRLAHLSARIAGRADELYVNFVGTEVRKGDPIYKIYSPELLTTQEEYILAVRQSADLRAKADSDPAARQRAENLVRSGRDRLLLWGITEEQVRRIEQTQKAETHLVIASPLAGVVIEKDIHAGHYVQVGEDPYTIADLSVVWMLAEVFERDIGMIEVGQVVSIESEAHPGERFLGTVTFILPMLDPATRTVKVRVDVPNPGRKLLPGMYVSAVLQIPLGRRAEVFWGC